MYFVSKHKYHEEKQILIYTYRRTFNIVAFIWTFLLHNYFYSYVKYKLETTVE